METLNGTNGLDVTPPSVLATGDEGQVNGAGAVDVIWDALDKEFDSLGDGAITLIDDDVEERSGTYDIAEVKARIAIRLLRAGILKMNEICIKLQVKQAVYHVCSTHRLPVRS